MFEQGVSGASDCAAATVPRQPCHKRRTGRDNLQVSQLAEKIAGITHVLTQQQPGHDLALL